MSGVDEVVRPEGGSVRDLLRVGPGAVDLAAIDPRSTPGLPAAAGTGKRRKEWARGQVELLGADLGRQQEMLYAAATGAAGAQAPTSAPSQAGAHLDGERPRRVLLVLQAMDCGGKDGTIKRVAGAMNPLGLHIRSFGPPTEEELSHDFLWRIRRALPPPGYVGVFNRSHYEDVLVARVESLVDEPTWQARYDTINAFERELAENSVTLVKVMLHISYAEQGERLAERLTDPTKFWKYNPSDLDTRAKWDEYQAAYADALSRCGTDSAPWFVVPADRKWYRDWAVAHLLRETFDTLDLGYPPADFDVEHERHRLRDQAERAKVNGG
ncbi:PPK2 family polyphosphate kinase [Micromonospora auratinigra]|uniref:Polyphosphate:nucleotide phosphotransferase, PPK2 family n=1 Tax=Micromonospora auratinigra TaxID=261654 RepID=A0A1A8ZX98_9ACTN|nr:PPK2 family polyphosphate kinase [Micromonospora auratinigra]SBT48512.1 polyphosphate:nucleotide phosphotransferase, PPK2 family [Micromonospora auratinigra]